MGINPHNISFVTGIGEKSVMNPHHRPSAADGVDEPVPGLLAGGPDQYLSDPKLQSLFDDNTPPALCYVDDINSYASNEIAINWNAPLVFVSGYLNGIDNISSINEGMGYSPEKFELMQNYPNPFNPSTNIKYKLKERDHIKINVFDGTGRYLTTIEDDTKDAGIYTAVFSTNAICSNISSGIYFYQISGSKKSITKKMVLVK
jgi:endoglucanase